MTRANSFATAALALCSAIALSPLAVAQMPIQLNDYPTEARAEYIFGCMQVNGNSRLALERCSCSIDVIASILPYPEYVDAETTMSLRQRGGHGVD